MSTQADLAAVVLAAGQGTRMRSVRPKVVHRLGGRPLIHYTLRAVREIGASAVIVVVGHEAALVQAACAGFDVRFAPQEEQRGTGHAALCAVRLLDGFSGDVLVLYGDLPLLSAASLRRLVAAHRAAGAGLSLLSAHLTDPSGYGRIVRQGGKVVRIVEQRDASAEELKGNEVNVGIYCARAQLWREALSQLRPDNAQRELYLTDIVALVIQRGEMVAAAPVPREEVAQVNWRGELAAMEKELRRRVNRKWMEAGVTLEDPETAYIEADVQIGRDTIIGPNVQLRGLTCIGERCRFDGTAQIGNSTLGDDVHVKLGVVISDAEVGARCEIGPFAQVRAGSRFAAGVVVGNFVETKQAQIDSGSKARHLAYLGDVEVGSGTNIGAGTITCNYDGFHKHRTVIGSRVMIGSDTQLVAPVRVGDDAYVASGTTVMKDVAAGALAFNQKNQLARKGWVARRRERAVAASATKSTQRTAKTRRGGATAAKPTRQAGKRARGRAPGAKRGR